MKSSRDDKHDQQLQSGCRCTYIWFWLLSILYFIAGGQIGYLLAIIGRYYWERRQTTMFSPLLGLPILAIDGLKRQCFTKGTIEVTVPFARQSDRFPATHSYPAPTQRLPSSLKTPVLWSQQNNHDLVPVSAPPYSTRNKYVIEIPLE